MPLFSCALKDALFARGVALSTTETVDMLAPQSGEGSVSGAEAGVSASVPVSRSFWAS